MESELAFFARDPHPAHQLETLLGELLQTSEGRAKILLSMKVPIERQLAYTAMPARAFYAHKEEVEGVEPEVVELPMVRLELDFTHTGVHPLTEEKKWGNAGSIFSRSIELCKHQFNTTLGEWFFAALEARATALSATFSQEGMDAVISDCVFMDARVYAGLRKSSWFQEHSELEGSAVILRTGRMGSYRDGGIVVTRLLPTDVMYSCENLGHLELDVQPVLLELTDTGAVLEVKCTARAFWKPGCITVRRWDILPTLSVAG